jgi:hypothetical protein
MAATGPWLVTPGRRGTGPLIEVDRRRATQGIDVVGAPAYDPMQKFAQPLLGKNCYDCAIIFCALGTGLPFAEIR